MNWSTIRTLVLIAPWASLAVHAQEPPPQSRPVPANTPALSTEAATTPPANSNLDGRLMYELLLGEFSVRDGAVSRGYAILLDAARRTGDASLYQRATDVALESRSGDAALQAIDAWRKAYPQSREANRYLLQTLLALNRTAETQEPLRREIEATPLPERPIAILAIPQLYTRSSERALAARVVESALQPSVASKEDGLATAAWTTIGRLRLQAGNTAGAREAAESAQQRTPTAEGPALLALELSGSDQRGAAIALLERYLQQPQARPEIRLDYARVLLQDERFDDVRTQLKQVTAVQPTPDDKGLEALGLGLPTAVAEAWLLLGLVDLQQQQTTEAEPALQRYLELSQNETDSARRSANRRQAYIALAQIAADRQDYAAADQWLTRIDDTGAAPDTLVRRANLLARQNRLDDALRLIREAPLPAVPTTQEADRVRTLAEIQVLRDNGQPRQAYARLNALNRAATQTGQPDPGLLYDQAMLAEEIGHTADIEPLLRKVIALSPDNAHAYNALGYSLADRGERLPEARELILKALALAPQDPYITDSLGWVEYRLGNLAEARRVLQQAYDLKPDAEIAVHLGEVLWKAGQPEEARAAWRNAQRLDGNHPALQKTLQRLGVGPL
ncbi:MAG: tetratricopeptide repeat protein [Comamonas sp.]